MLVRALPTYEEILAALDCTAEEFDALPDEDKGKLMFMVAELGDWFEI